MHRTAIVAATLAAILPAAHLPDAEAAPREEALRADLVRGLLEVCIPAQTREASAKAFVDDRTGALGLRPMRFSNTTNRDAWMLSSDRRATLFSDPDLCYVSVEVRTVGEPRLVADLHADLLALSAVEPNVTGTPEGASFAAGYCAQLRDGGLASFNMLSSVSGMEPGLGRVAPGQRRTVVVSAPRVSECGGAGD